MIVEIDEEDWLVVGFDSIGRWYCVRNGELPLRRFLTYEIKLKDQSIPINWVLTKYYFPDWNQAPADSYGKAPPPDAAPPHPQTY